MTSEQPAITKVFALLLLLAVVAAPALAQDDVSSSAIKGGRIRIELGKSHLLKDVASYEITDRGVLDASGAPGGDLILKGKSAGSTTLLVRKTGLLGIIVYEVTVVGVNIDEILLVVKEALGGIVGLSISKEGNIIVLDGDVVERDDGRRVDRQIEFNGTTILDLTERSYLANDLAVVRQQLEKSGYSQIETEGQLDKDGANMLLIRGTVPSQAQKDDILSIASKFFDEGHLVDQVSVDDPLIEVDVEVYTLNLTKARSVGTNTMLSKISETASSGWTFETGPPIHVIGRDGSRTELAHTTSYPTITTGAFSDEIIKASINDGAVTNISTQHASVRSGQSATVDNTQDNYLKITSEQDATLEKISVGQILNITPTIMKSGKFETDVSIELSELVDVSNQSGIDVGVANRSVQMTYVSATDERVVLGGVRKRSASSSESRTPLLGRIPIVNMLFRAKGRQYDETMQVFFMTLRLPTTLEAIGDAQSAVAPAQQENVSKGLAKTKKILDRHLRWE